MHTLKKIGAILMSTMVLTMHGVNLWETAKGLSYTTCALSVSGTIFAATGTVICEKPTSDVCKELTKLAAKAALASGFTSSVLFGIDHTGRAIAEAGRDVSKRSAKVLANLTWRAMCATARGVEGGLCLAGRGTKKGVTHLWNNPYDIPKVLAGVTAVGIIAKCSPSIVELYRSKGATR